MMRDRAMPTGDRSADHHFLHPAFVRTRTLHALAQATVLQSLLHAAHRTAARHYPDPRTLRGLAESLHDVVTEKIGQQNQQFRARRQVQGLFLMRRISPTDVVRDGDVVSFEQIGDVAEPIRSDDDCADRLHAYDPDS